MQKELEQLKMEKAIFKVEIISKDNIANQNDNKHILEDRDTSKVILSKESDNGIDNVRFVASTIPGMQLAPIDKISSGGELSRFMLAPKICLFDKLLKETIIF